MMFFYVLKRRVTWAIKGLQNRIVAAHSALTRHLSSSLLLQIVLLFITLILCSTAALGWLAYAASRETVTQNALDSAATAADARRSLLVQMLSVRKTRAESFLNELSTNCKYRGSQKTGCVNRYVRDFVNGEHVVAARLIYPGVGAVNAGMEGVNFDVLPLPQPGEIARFFHGTDGRAYFVLRIMARKNILNVLQDASDLAEVFSRSGAAGARSVLISSEGVLLPVADTEIRVAKLPAWQGCTQDRQGQNLGKDERGEPVIYAYRRLEEAGGLCVSAQIRQRDAFAPLTRLKNQIIGVFTFLTGVAFILAILFARLLDRPFAALTDRARALQSGDFDSPVLADGPWEVKPFADTFTEMARTLKLRVSQQALIASLGQRALSGSGLDLLLDETVMAVASLFGAEYCRIVELLPDEKLFVLRAGIGWQEFPDETQRKLGEDAAAARALEADAPILIEGSAAAQHPTLLYERGTVSGISVKIAGAGQPFGILAVHTTRPKTFAADDVHFVQAIANVLAAAVDRKRTEAALEKAIRDLKLSNEELEHFAYIVSHDLTEPLRMVTSYLQLLVTKCDGKLEPEAQKYINFAVDGGQRAQQLIRDLLDYAKLGSAAKPFGPVECEAIFERTLANLSVAIQESRAMVTTGGPLPCVKGDAGQLTQLFQNLIGNAIKFRGSALPHVQISAATHEGGWLFAVHDNGIGLDPLHAERIFEIFQRLNDRAQYPGTGIGLAICKKIVEGHRGRIWVESRPGAGSTFYFTLPPAETPASGPFLVDAGQARL